ncbi:TolC family protein [Trichlorobacter lovleyi]|uniref:TolC family protein n=1 Tax=Trichlorobacter lovleyi TaxID=313985 RepID=UPI00223F7A4B|nr:TolC family protein [Trichlorobacter lovleyi]QOX78613.1 TolC family protein [Trichlorobacter lovleyi]
MKNLLVVVLVLGFGAVTELRAEPVRLTMADAVKMAVEKNLDLRVELYNPAQQEAEYQKSRGIYNPALTLQTSYNDTTSYSASLPAGRYWNRSTQLNGGISQLLPSGATAALGFNNNYLSSDVTSASSGLSSYWQSSLGLTLNQPLLKNFGREPTELTIDTARLTKDASLEKLNTKLISVVAQVRTEYYKLYSLREELAVRKVSLDLARRILSETQARVKAGVMPAMEILNAEFGVASREKELIDAERAVQDQVDVLVQLLQLQPAQGQGVETVEVPSKGRYEVSEQAEIKRALNNRPELKELKRNLELLELQTRVSGNRTRPDLLLSASAATAGLGATYPRDLDRLSSGTYPAWGVGLAFSYPLGNQAAENEYRKNRLKLDQSALQIRNQEELIANEVRSAVRAIEANYKQLDVADRGRAFAEERLRAFVRKAEVGLATNKDVLDVENDLATAKNNQIKAQVAYANAITQLWKATGEILAKEQVRVLTLEPDSLYKSVN